MLGGLASPCTYYQSARRTSKPEKQEGRSRGEVREYGPGAFEADDFFFGNSFIEM